MPPRYLNPHLANVLTEKTSRDAVFHESNFNLETQANDADERQLLLNELDKRLHDSLDFVLETGSRKRKRRKPSEESSKMDSLPYDLTEPISFKLLAGTEKPIRIEPLPPKLPSFYREPTYEDTEEAASKRRERSMAVAVDFNWVIKESHKTQLPFPSWNSRVVDASTLLPPDTENDSESSPPMAILRYLQPPRKTRPPVPRDETELLSHYPYAAGAALPPHDSQERLHRKVSVKDITLKWRTGLK